MAYVFLIFQLAFAVFFFFLCLAFLTGAPFVPSTDRTAQKMAEMADIRPGDTIVDLGSGDGKLLILAAARGAKAVGIEINPFLVLWSWLRTRPLAYGNRITVRWGDLWSADLKNCDTAFIYLLPWKMDRLQKKLLSEMKPGSKIVSNSFLFPDWKPSASDDSLHVYRFTVAPKDRKRPNS